METIFLAAVWSESGLQRLKCDCYLHCYVALHSAAAIVVQSSPWGEEEDKNVDTKLYWSFRPTIFLFIVQHKIHQLNTGDD